MAIATAVVWLLLTPVGGGAAEPGDGRLRVITYNVAGIPLIDPTRSARMAAIDRELGRAGHDIALIQEAWLDKDAMLLEREGGFAHRARRGGGLLGNGLLILSRRPIAAMSRRLFTLKSRGSKDDWIERGALAARVETPHGPWDVYAAHLTHVKEASAVRLAQIFELAEFVREFSGDRPFLLGGDFNAPPESLEAKVLRGLLGVQDPCLGAEGERCGTTSPGSGWRIDYLFVADAAAVSPRTAFGGTFPHAGRELAYSDHLAVEAVLGPDLLRVSARARPDHEQWALRTIAEALEREVRRLQEAPSPGRPDSDLRTDDVPIRAVLERVLRRVGVRR